MSAATVVLTAIYWRNAWKYQARAYRHRFWDSGAMLANLLAAAGAMGIPARLITLFLDERVNRLLALDSDKEVSLELVPLGSAPAPAVSPAVEPISPRSLPLSSSEVDYPLAREIHVASSTALFHATRGIPADFLPGPGHRLVDLYLIVNAVDGIASGAYCYWREAHGLELLQAGDFRGQAGYLCLGQALGSDASAVIFFLADLGPLLERFGNRGYRLANLEAGVIGGKCYLGAYGQGFGASGLTFYDGDVVRFFSPHARGKDALFVTVLGRSVRGAPGIEEVPLQLAKK